MSIRNVEHDSETMFLSFSSSTTAALDSLDGSIEMDFLKLHTKKLFP